MIKILHYLFLCVFCLNYTNSYAGALDDLANQKQAEIAEQKKQAYVRANELLVDLNKKDGKLAGKKTATVSRTDGAPNALLVPAFRNEIGQNSIESGPDAFYVLSVKKAIAPKVEKKKMDSLRKEMENLSAQALQEDYNSFLMREYPVEINEKVYNRVFVK